MATFCYFRNKNSIQENSRFINWNNTDTVVGISQVLLEVSCITHLACRNGTLKRAFINGERSKVSEKSRKKTRQAGLGILSYFAW